MHQRATSVFRDERHHVHTLFSEGLERDCGWNALGVVGVCHQ